MSFLKRLFREPPRGLNPGFSEAARLLSHADPPRIASGFAKRPRTEALGRVLGRDGAGS